MAGKSTVLGVGENVEALLTYLLGWLTGLIFLLIERENKFVRFHAMQSTITFLGLSIISIVLTPLAVVPFLGLLVFLVNFLTSVVTVIVWVVCMVKAFQGVKFKLPITGDLAEKYA